MDDFIEGGDLHSKTYANSFGQLTGISPAMLILYDLIHQCAPTANHITISGEKGAGKTTCAQAIHFYSEWKNHPFITIASDEELLSFYNNKTKATLYIKNTGTLSLASQKIIKSLLKTSKSIRIIFRDIGENNFPQMITDNIKLVHIHVPALRERRKDVIDLADFYISFFAKKYKKQPPKLSENAAYFLQQYQWPQNVSELKSMIADIIYNHEGKILLLDAFPEKLFQTAKDPHKARAAAANAVNIPLWKIEKRAIEEVILHCQGNIAQAALILGISPSTIYRKQKEWDTL